MELPTRIKKPLKRIRNMIAPRRRKNKPIPKSPEWQEMKLAIESATTLVDLGCGINPHPRATVAVDAFLQPEHRLLGEGETIDASHIEWNGVRFVHADIHDLPFETNSFDFAYSHHVFEHLDDPKQACQEMCRIANAGVIITPAPFAEIAFGRRYHKWLVTRRGNRIIFVEKRPEEDLPFGEHPEFRPDGTYQVRNETNPFYLLLNYDNSYTGPERFPRLSMKLRAMWDSHSAVMETVFVWKDEIECTVIYTDGTIR